MPLLLRFPRHLLHAQRTSLRLAHAEMARLSDQVSPVNFRFRCQTTIPHWDFPCMRLPCASGVAGFGRFDRYLASRLVERWQQLPFLSDLRVSGLAHERCCYAQKLTSGTQECAQD